MTASSGRESLMAAPRLRCLRASGHPGDHIFATRKPIGDRYADGEFQGQYDPNEGIAFPGVTVPANVPRCRGRRRV